MLLTKKDDIMTAVETLYVKAVESVDEGCIASRPVDDMAIMAYGITDDEMAPYMNGEHLGKHWSDILDEILETRKNANKSSE